MERHLHPAPCLHAWDARLPLTSCGGLCALQSRHHWLLTVAAEGVVRLLYPLKFQHVYIPVMPSSLADYLEVRQPGHSSSTAFAGPANKHGGHTWLGC